MRISDFGLKNKDGGGSLRNRVGCTLAVLRYNRSMWKGKSAIRNPHSEIGEGLV